MPSDQEVDLSLLILHLGSERVGAVSAEVLVLVPIRQNEQKALAHRHSLPAPRAEESAGFELSEGSLGSIMRIGAAHGLKERYSAPRIHLAPTISKSISM